MYADIEWVKYASRNSLTGIEFKHV